MSLTKKEKYKIIEACKRFNIRNYTINKDGSIDVDNHINMSNCKLTKIPDILKFNKVSGYFDCRTNKLKSLKGFPKRAKGLNCRFNKITNLEGIEEDQYNVDFANNPIGEILNLFECHPKCIYWINEYDVIQGNKVIFQRLEAVAYELKMELPEEIVLKNYILI